MARFSFVKPLETFDFTYRPSIDKKQVLQLASCHYIEHGDNVIVARVKGTGTWIRQWSVLGLPQIGTRAHQIGQSPPSQTFTRCGEKRSVVNPSRTRRSVFLPENANVKRAR